MTLAWLGRDDYSASDLPAVREEAARAHNQRTAEYLLGMPLVDDFLEEGLSMLGSSCGEFEIERRADMAVLSLMSTVISKAEADEALIVRRFSSANRSSR